MPETRPQTRQPELERKQDAQDQSNYVNQRNRGAQGGRRGRGRGNLCLANKKDIITSYINALDVAYKKLKFLVDSLKKS